MCDVRWHIDYEQIERKQNEYNFIIFQKVWLIFSITENKVPQNRETREKMRKPRLKKFSNLSIFLTK